MPVQRDQKPPVSPKAREMVNDFSGGHNSTINSTLLNKNEAQIAENVSLEQKGTLRARKGRSARYAAPFINEAVSGITGYYKKDGTSRIVMAAGTRLFYDRPALVFNYTAKSDYDSGSLSKFANTEVIAGSIVLVGSFFGMDGDCTSTAPFTAIDLTLSVDSTVAKYGTTCLKAELPTGKTTGKVRIPIHSMFNKSKHHGFSLWASGDVTTAKLKLVKTDGTTVVDKTLTLTGDFTVDLIKATPANMAESAFLEVEVTGTAGKFIRIDGIVALPITVDEYNAAGYVMPTYNTLEPCATSTDLLVALGTCDGTSIQGDCVVLNKEFTETTTQDDTSSNESLTNASVTPQGVLLSYAVTWGDLGLTTVWNTL